MHLDQFCPPAPIPLGPYRDLTLFAEGQGFALPRVHAMLGADADHYSDLCGRTVGLIMPLLDWRVCDLPFCVTACHGDQVVASDWAGTVAGRENGTIGCNLSFGVRPEFGGRGLATILSAIAFQQCLADASALEFVNVQTEAGNAGARAVTTRLQLGRAPLFDREVGTSAPRVYVTYRASADVVTSRCAVILLAAGIDYSVPPVRRPARRLMPDVQPRIALPPSIAALLPSIKGPTMTTSSISTNNHAAASARAAKSKALTAIDDESTVFGAITVSNPPNAAEALLQLLAPILVDSPEARRAIERSVATIVRQFSRNRVTVLTDEERQHLIDGMVAARKTWEKSGDDEWISDVVHHGYDGYMTEPDVGLLESAFCDNPIFTYFTADAARLTVLQILTKPEAMDIICSPKRAQPVNDFNDFDRHIRHTIGPMTATGSTSRPEDVLEALQLHGIIQRLLAERLGEDEAQDEPDAPRT